MREDDRFLRGIGIVELELALANEFMPGQTILGMM